MYYTSPLSFLRNGYFNWYGTSLDDRGSYGNLWSLRSATAMNSNTLDYNYKYLSPQNTYEHGYGFAVR